jgi:hypothetical protein
MLEYDTAEARERSKNMSDLAFATVERKPLDLNCLSYVRSDGKNVPAKKILNARCDFRVVIFDCRLRDLLLQQRISVL